MAPKPTAAASPLRLHRLEVENFMRLRLVSLRFERGATLITGKNAQGKSTALNALLAACGGKALCPDDPIRHGELAARSEAVLRSLDGATEYHVVRTWERKTLDGKIKSELQVLLPNGGIMPAPQDLLDRLIGVSTKIAFAPLAFAEMGRDAKGRAEQASILKAIAGYDTSDLDADRLGVVERRKQANKEVKRLEVLVGELETKLPPAPEPLAQEPEVSVAEMARELQAAAATATANAKARAAAEKATKDATAAAAEVTRLKSLLAAAEEKAARLATAAETAQQEAAALVDPSTDEIAERMEQAETTNAAVRSRREAWADLQRKRKAAEEALAKERTALEVARDGAASLQLRLEEIDRKKEAALAAAKFPIKGLGVDGDTVMLNGHPFDQASGAERLRASLAIYAALNPGIKTIPVQEHARLDEEGLLAVAQWAEEAGVDVILERVMDAPGQGIFIEDGGVLEVGPNAGRVVAASTPAPATPAQLELGAPEDDDLPTF